MSIGSNVNNMPSPLLKPQGRLPIWHADYKKKPQRGGVLPPPDVQDTVPLTRRHSEGDLPEAPTWRNLKLEQRQLCQKESELREELDRLKLRQAICEAKLSQVGGRGQDVRQQLKAMHRGLKHRFQAWQVGQQQAREEAARMQELQQQEYEFSQPVPPQQRLQNLQWDRNTAEEERRQVVQELKDLEQLTQLVKQHLDKKSRYVGFWHMREFRVYHGADGNLQAQAESGDQHAEAVFTIKDVKKLKDNLPKAIQDNQKLLHDLEMHVSSLDEQIQEVEGMIPPPQEETAPAEVASNPPQQEVPSQDASSRTKSDSNKRPMIPSIRKPLSGFSQL